MSVPDPRVRDVRPDDALDTAALGSWLWAQLPDLNGQVPAVRQFAGGASNLTYLLSFEGGRELVLRRPPRGARSGAAHNMAREFMVQQRLKSAFSYVPTVHALCEDESVLGAPFYVMERVAGVVCGLPVPAEIGSSPERLAGLGERFVSVMAELHAVDVEAAGLADLGRGPGYVARQVAQWSDRYRRARTRNVPSFEPVMAWLDANQPARDSGACLIHNDFRLDNMIFDREIPLQVNGVLDWEMATVGDPLMDLGGSLAYWIEPGDPYLARRFAMQPTTLPGAPSRAQIVARYGELTGRSMDAAAFYEVFGMFRLAVIAQQIYHRYATGGTTNPRFKNWWVLVRSSHRRCRRRIRAA